MKTEQKIARSVGVMLIIGTVAGISSIALTGSIFGAPDYLTRISANVIQFITGTLLVLIMGFALASVPVMMFPIFKQYNEPLALGSVIFRGALETSAYIAIAVCWLLLLSLSQEYINAEPPDLSLYQILGTLILKTVNIISQILAIVFSLGALMFYFLFYRSKLIPRWLSTWGLAGAVLYLSVPLTGMFNIDCEFLYAPLATQEMVLAVWLIINGFNPPRKHSGVE
ncbi:hypothetical protein DGMP_24260 [Desulfomarina profundi]|uniref:DUF4386 domain-containing protein n=1 Tax=Desulfomarina profundi TaxID=2772557 RepID=A0A8D5FME5_9BACT|nr:DUF4386 domain-containing protein [Desulfomarina profundi]BCL61733.1 hypothetical protein DGMP_24260 [Desulfomarina profundi]